MMRIRVCSSSLPPHRRNICEQASTLVLDRSWALPFPDTRIDQVIVSDCKTSSSSSPFSFSISPNQTTSSSSSFYVVRDDLLHPLVNGNKARKLDALLPLLQHHNVTHVVTCGGSQSAHAAALAVSCAERGLTSHLLLRGEAPHITTGYNLISTIYANVTYVPRSLYANREQMLHNHALLLAGTTGSVLRFTDILEASLTNIHTTTHGGHFPTKVVIVNEGAADTAALFGVIRLVHYLSQPHLLGNNRPVKLVVDAGTGTTAIGLGLGVVCLGLPWEVTAIMLADTIVGYKEQEKRLISEFKRCCCAFNLPNNGLGTLDNGIVSWVERAHPRKFGNVMKGEVEACQQIAKQTGILVDPVYTLAAWELATSLSQQNTRDDAQVVMLHTGGTLGMFGLAQRYKSYFHTPEALPL